MCGITGYWNQRGNEAFEAIQRRISAMTASLYHRGPDSGGIWIRRDCGVALGHRRLAIRDLSPTGRQPMVADEGRFVLCYNGEIYNAEELRKELTDQSGIAFKGHSDTEVILHGCAVWGVEALCKRLIGMFAFAFWDSGKRRLTLARDRMGIKPLYWEFHGGALAFASELKAFVAGRAAAGEKSPDVDLDAVALMMRHSYIPSPLSVYRGVRKLEAGCLLELEQGGEPAVRAFWDSREVFRQGTDNRFHADDTEAIGELESLLRDAVGRRMVSDVPLGAFLSGGIDSSLVAALMQAQSERPIRTFSIGFAEKEFNEAHHAKEVARHLGTDHTERYLTPRDAMDMIPRIPEFYDEPFADASQLPTYLLSRMTRDYVTVALSGDGGDELFTGYVHYNHPMAKAMASTGLFRKALKCGIRMFPPALWDKMACLLPERMLPATRRKGFGKRLYRRMDGIKGDFLENYRSFLSIWPNPLELVPGAADRPGVFADRTIMVDAHGNIDAMQFVDSVTYMSEDILAKVDRASMAVSLEVRVPIIDHRVYAFAWRLPMSMRVRNGKGKWILRKILHKYVPEKLVERPKMGFSVPIFDWLRGPMREWAESLLEPARLRREGVLDAGLVADAWLRLQEGELVDRQVWNVLMFQAWLEKKDDVRGDTAADGDVMVEVA